MNRIVAIITAKTGDRVVVCERELTHAQKHFILPRDILLELLERILKDPTEVFVDDSRYPREYRLFYRVSDSQYVLAVIKLTSEGCYFTSMYPTGADIKKKHKNLKRIRI